MDGTQQIQTWWCRFRFEGRVSATLCLLGTSHQILLPTFTDRSSLQRYYGRAHQYVVGRTVSDDSDLESGGEGAAQASAKGSTNEPPAKRVRTVSNKAPPGRVKTGYDFWSIIDRVFSKDLDRLGKDMKNDKWRE
ncbi:hypothetical protein M404DRAFT_655299 [Pisolithus tinctorius Marx 270]|uniref:Uncharacterized protein n=1 Tax=Pisolithus tinctorius Marx 270 TaxID=870435 RepID=A0A0C3I6Q3_PISTI|nr:hypothetical protein M404DRAFT_655299 [Pisolithus tinctorius Marx 270]